MQTSPWIDALERRYGHWAVPNLTRILVGVNILAWLLEQFSPGFARMLVLYPQALAAGEFWRLFTFLIVPPVGEVSFLFLFLFYYFLWIVGEYLETEWGSFKVNLYYLIGMVALIAVCFWVPPGRVHTMYLNTSLFLALGTALPELVFYVYFVLPVKVRFLAWLAAGGLIFAAFPPPGDEIFIVLASVLNYLLFFGPEFLRGKGEEWEARRRRERFK